MRAFLRADRSADADANRLSRSKFQFLTVTTPSILVTFAGVAVSFRVRGTQRIEASGTFMHRSSLLITQPSVCVASSSKAVAAHGSPPSSSILSNYKRGSRAAGLVARVLNLACPGAYTALLSHMVDCHMSPLLAPLAVAVESLRGAGPKHTKGGFG